MRYIVTYDIVEDDVRNKVSNFLISQGMVRIQYSVYMGELGRAELRAVQTMLTELTKDSISNVQFFSQCTKCIDRQRSIEVVAGIDHMGEDAELRDELTEGVEDRSDIVSEGDIPEIHKEDPEVTETTEETRVEADSVSDKSPDSGGREEGETDHSVAGDTDQEGRGDTDNTVRASEEETEDKSWTVLTIDDLMEFLIKNNFEPVITPIRKVRRRRRARTTRSVVRDLSSGAVIL